MPTWMRGPATSFDSSEWEKNKWKNWRTNGKIKDEPHGMPDLTHFILYSFTSGVERSLCCSIFIFLQFIFHTGFGFFYAIFTFILIRFWLCYIVLVYWTLTVGIQKKNSIPTAESMYNKHTNVFQSYSYNLFGKIHPERCSNLKAFRVWVVIWTFHYIRVRWNIELWTFFHETGSINMECHIQRGL